MSENKLKIGVAVIAVLVVANIILHLIWNWGLITVKVTDQPIGKVIASIERQGWVKIYSNIDPQTKVSMYVDHVPLAEAMATLAVNADAQWHLGFFVAPNSADVKAEIRTFTDGADENDDSTKIYSFPTPLDMLADESTPEADPRGQIWPGLKAPAPAPAPPANGDSTAANDAPRPEDPPASVQGYLRAFAEEADIWIMAPASWDPAVAAAPPPSSSISSAIKHFVSRAHGSVTQALILRGRPPRTAGGGRPRGGFRGAGMDMGDMTERLDNAINGLPPSARPAMRQQLQEEVKFQKAAAAAPPDERRKMWMDHMLKRRLGGDRGWRLSPEKRAQFYTRLVNNRIAAQGK